MSMSPYLLECSVCKGEYFSKSEWLEHLTTEGHQTLAREECLRKWGKSKMKKCCLVIFSSFPLTPEYSGGDGGGDKVIQCFSNNPTTFVTDFVFWEGRPRIGVVQFESKKKVADVISSLGDSTELLIDDQRVEVKRAFQLSDLEWNAILPVEVENPFTSNNGASMEIKIKSKSIKSPSQSILANSQMSTAESKERSTTGSDQEISLEPKTSRKRKLSSNTLEKSSSKKLKQKKKHSDDESSIAKSFPALNNKATISTDVNAFSSTTTSLQFEISNVIKSVTISESEYEKGLKVSSDLKRLLKYDDPSTEVAIFRNWYLKLRNQDSVGNDLILYAYSPRPPPHQPLAFCCIKTSVIGLTFHMPDGLQKFSVLESADHQKAFPDSQVTSDKIWKVKHKSTDINFYIATAPSFIVEVQMCRMVEYLLTFDSRCHSLMALVHYWAKLNSVHFGNILSPSDIYRGLPEPITMQWIVIFFLCHKKIIPTPREIQSTPHKILKERFAETDVGFHADPEYVKEWKLTRNREGPSSADNDQPDEEFLVKVLVLFQEFLQFCGGKLASGNWFLNTRDGELISIEQFLNCAPKLGSQAPFRPSWKTKMTNEEIAKLTNSQLKRPPSNNKLETENEEGNENEGAWKPSGYISYLVKAKEENLYIIHPFIFSWRFSVSKEMSSSLKRMGTSGTRLEEFLTVCRMDGVDAAKKQFGTLESVLTVKVNI